MPYTTATPITPCQPLNCSMPEISAKISPRPKPTYGMNTASPVNTPTGTARSKPNSVRPTL